MAELLCIARRTTGQPLSLRGRCFLQKRPLSLAYTLHKADGRKVDHNRPSIVIMHGLFGSKQNNRSISKAIARDLNVPVFAIDLRNHGDSPHDVVHDYSSMTRDVEEFIEQHSLGSPILIGHSMGAKVAMAVALRNPGNAAAVVPVDNAPVDAVLKSKFSDYVQAMRKILEAGVTKQAEADGILQNYEEALPIRQFLLTNLVRDPDSKLLKFRIPVHILGAALDKMGDFPFKDPASVRFDGPSLFIRGTLSHYVPDEMLPVIGQFFPRFELKDIPCGHWVISEQPDAFKRAVVEFITEKDWSSERHRAG